MFAIIIGDSPDHIIYLNQINSVLTHLTNVVSDDAFLSLSDSDNVTLTKDQISDLSEWVKDMIYSLNQLSDSTVDTSDEQFI
jgi:hypothetical protein